MCARTPVDIFQASTFHQYGVTAGYVGIVIMVSSSEYINLPGPGVSPKVLDEGFWIEDTEEDCGIRQYQTH